MPAYQVDVQLAPDVEAALDDAALARLSQAAQAALHQQGVAAEGSLTLLLTDDDALQQLNHTYRQIDAPTDVLSFPDGSELPQIGVYFGDIAISLPTAQQQADKVGHSLLTELELLTVHGVLHLLGHDHAEPNETQQMWVAQNTILASLDNPIRYE